MIKLFCSARSGYRELLNNMSESMINARYKISFFIFLYCFLTMTVSLSAMNFLRPYDVLQLPEYRRGRTFQPFVLAGTGVRSAQGFGESNGRCNVLQIWQPEQNAFSMLRGANEQDSCIEQRINSLQRDYDDLINKFGLFNMCADLDLKWDFSVNLRYFFCQDWILSLYIPFCGMKLHNVQFHNAEDDLTAEDITEFKALTNYLGEGLELNPWERSGIGDIVLFVDWFRNFPQPKPFLKNVRINWRIGASLPTGKRIDPDQLFSIPFGNDGAFALPFALDLEVTLGRMIKAGVDVQLQHIFDATRTRRIKTNAEQTDLLFLQKTQVHTDFGLTQQFDLWFQLYRIIKGFSIKVGYQFYKQGENVVSFKTNAFPGDIANTAESLQDWTSHQIIVNAHYHFMNHCSNETWAIPQCSAYVWLPVNGSRSALFPQFGFMIAADF